MDAAILLRYEQTLRPEPLRWVDWMSGQQAKVMGALDAMEADAPAYCEGFDIGHVATACAVGYLDLRFGHFGWRNGRPELATWFAEVSKRPSMIGTFPKG
jgi:glutathione S-transferase